MSSSVKENHYAERITWLRAAVLGANDGIISVSSLILGVAAASSDQSHLILTGVAGMVSGAMSMAAGEYVSVSSQADLEKAEIARERKELSTMPEQELQEMSDIYIARGVAPDLAREVVRQMSAKDALGLHAREELGISEITIARPLQAATASAIAFSIGAAFPLLTIMILPTHIFVAGSSAICIITLGLMGALAAYIGGAHPLRPALRVMFWGAMAMLFTSLIGSLFE